MGHVNVVSGHIREVFYFGGDPARSRLLLESNRRVLRALPAVDDWPCLPRSMFSVTAGGARSPAGTQYRGRVIHFGASYNQVLDSFDSWRAKFEALLRQLYWDQAMAMVQTEWWGTHAFEWRRSLEAGERMCGDPPEPVSDWRFESWRLDSPPIADPLDPSHSS